MAKGKNTSNERRVVTPKARAMYAFVQRPRASMNEGEEPSYSITLVFDKNADLSALKKAARLARDFKWPKNPPSNLRSPFRNGDDDRPDDEDFKGKIFITAKSKDKPGLLDRNREPMEDPNDFYSGCYCRARVIAYPYDKRGNKGIAFALESLQKMGDGDRLSGRPPADEGFDDLGDEEDADLGF